MYGSKLTALAEALAALQGRMALLELDRERNDLLFRRGRQFCNIGPKIRQYG